MTVKRWLLDILITTSTLIFLVGYSIESYGTDQVEQENIGERINGVLHVSAAEAASLIAKDIDIKILDVRTGWEYDRGHLEGAVSLNYYWFGFEEKLSALDKEITWLVHCKSGVRSANTLPLMIKAGFKSIIHLDGGIDAWRIAGLSMVKARLTID